jgi:hypothetical protein
MSRTFCPYTSESSEEIYAFNKFDQTKKYMKGESLVLAKYGSTHGQAFDA